MVYDAQGNPTTYMGKSLTWEKGRQLKALGSNTYTYNANGIRTGKKVGTVQHTYTLDGTKIQRETWDGNTLVPLYDNEDDVCGVIYNGAAYYFQKNLQGDVIAIADQNAETVARYTYDAWGVCTVTADTSGVDIAAVNPYRYRSYYYDTETGLYYLQSRYYDPVVGRFLNADAAEFLGANRTIGSYNLFAYCGNNPVNFTDPAGNLVVVFGVALTAGQIIACIAILGFAILYAFDPTFRNSFNQLVWMLLSGAFTMFQALIIVLTGVLQAAKARTKINGSDNHHIVAKKDHRAAGSRSIIHNAGIGINDSRNLVRINRRFHWCLHTGEYHRAVYNILYYANRNRRATDVISALALIKITIYLFTKRL